MRCSAIGSLVRSILLCLNSVAEIVDQTLVEIFAAEEGVTVGGEHFKLLFTINVSDLDDRDVDRAAAKVMHGELAVFLDLVDTERERGSRRLVDDALDFEARDAARRPWWPGAANR